MLLGLLLTALPGRAEPPDDEVRAGLVEQVDLPALEHRKDAADARFEAATAAFRGDISLDRAFPHLASVRPLPDDLWVSGQLARLDATGAERAADRVLRLDDERLEIAREAALSAEDAADGLERRYLLSIRAQLHQHPRLESGSAALFEAYADERSRIDPEDTLAIARVDEEARMLSELLLQVRAIGSVPSATLSIANDLERLADPELAEHAAERLLLVRDLLDDTSEIDPALESWLESTTAPDVATVQAADAELARLALRSEGVHWGPEQAWLERVQEALGEDRERLAVEQARIEDGATVDLEVEAARQAAETAEATAGLDDAAAEVVAATYAEVTRATQIRGEVEAEDLTFDEREAAFRIRLADLQATRADLLARPPLDAARETDAIDAWRQSRDLVVELRDTAFTRPSIEVDSWARERSAEIGVAEALLAADVARVHDLGDAGVSEALDRREQTLRAERQDVLRRTNRAEVHDAAILELLSQAKQVRRELKVDVPRAVWLAEEEIIDEALTEAQLLAPSVWALGRHRLTQLLAWPSVGQALGMLRGLVGLGLIGLLWWALRSRSDLLVGAVVRRWSGAGREAKRRLSRIQPVITPLTPVVRAGFDVLGVWLLFEPTMEVLPELGIVLLVYGQVAAFRLLVGGYHLLVARYAESRPAFFFVSPSVYGLGENTVRWLVIWAVGRQFVSQVLLGLLGADALHELTMRAFAVVLVVLVVRLLHLWEPELRHRISRQGTDSPLHGWLISEPSTATRWLRALIATGLLGVGASWRFAQAQVSEGSALGRLLNLFYRYQLGEQEESFEIQPLPKEVREALDANAMKEDWIIEHTELDKAFWASVLAWRDQKQRGVMALIADRGGGRQTWLDVKTQKLADKGYGVARISLEHRITGEEPLCMWLSRSLGAPVVKTVPELVEALEKRPPTVVVLERAHYVFLRTVGGFEAMRALLEVIGASPRHFWLCCFHKPSWGYLSRLDRLLKIHLFREVVELPALQEAELQKLTRDRTAAAGYRVDFGGLVRRGALSGDIEGELERATRAFYRVLGEASLGNPAVALKLWRESLTPTSDKTLQVRLGAAVQESRAVDLAEPELFTLAALRMQEGLSEPELAQVNNVSAAAVRASLQVLAAKGLVEPGHLDGWEVPLRHLATVTRTLAHKNLIEWR